MLYSESVLFHTPNYQLVKIRGEVEKKNPFEAFFFKVKKLSIVCRIHHSNPPQKVSEMVCSYPKNIAAINGGFYKLTKRNRTPLDWLIVNKFEIQSLRNQSRPCVFIFDGGAYIASPSNQDQFHSVLQAGPLLVHNNIIQTDYSDFQEKAYDFDTDITIDRNPRSVFGYDSKHYFLLVVEGRSDRSYGLFLEETALLAQKCGMTEAINLDGGGSCTLIVENKLINEPRFAFRSEPHPLDSQVQGKERLIPTALLLNLR
ncbi:phosphodiester glycosidase family protein [Candidatus Lokiarchaeum ossiferum]|uniref:phosphodiester glycosidase family protein n=1 Tax=Candidatus Lokiarchaeum ossiferum TaxID=2951803 RepID=UPI00352DEB27